MKRKPWADRGSRQSRGYGAEWQRIRQWVLHVRDGKICQPCLRSGKRIPNEAAEVDHIMPKHKGGSDDEANLQAICEPCHKAKTARENAERLRVTPRLERADGWRP